MLAMFLFFRKLTNLIYTGFVCNTNYDWISALSSANQRVALNRNLCKQHG